MREKQINVRVTESERRLIFENAGKHGCSPQAYMRELALEKVQQKS